MDKPVERKGMGGLGKMGGKMPDERPGAQKAPEQGKVGGDDGSVTTITHHSDGTHSMQHDGGEESQHPDHMHMMAQLGHHVTGGDKHHVVHHDGMSMHSHGIHEDGQHEESHDHGNIEELKDSMGKFLDEEGKEGGDWSGDGKEETEPAYGGM